MKDRVRKTEPLSESVVRSFRRVMTSKAHLNACEAVTPLLSLARWTGVLPLIPCIKKNEQSILQCCFKVSKIWTIFSIFIQIIYVPFVIILLMDLSLGFSQTEVLWNALKVMFLVHIVEMYAILILGVVQVKKMSKIMEQLTSMPSSPEDIKWIGKFLKIILAILILFFSLYSCCHILQIWVQRETIVFFAVKNFSRSIMGILTYNYLAVFTQVQCLVCVMLCLLVSSKFKYLTNLIQVTFNKTSNPFILDNQKTIFIQPTTNLSPINKNHIFKIDPDYLENLHIRYCEINECLRKINNRIGFQLFLSISVILYTLIYFIFCEISVEGYNDDLILVFTSIFGTCVLTIRLALYMWVGEKVKVESTGPLQALQNARLLHHSSEIQQHLQLMLLQWSSTEPGYLNAFHVMNVGPWLLTSIIGNIITYLLVFVQISKSQASSNKS